MSHIERENDVLLLARYRVSDGPAAGHIPAAFMPAHDVRLDCAVDILMAPAPTGTPQGDRFAARAHAVAALQHPALPLIHDMGIAGDRLAVVYRRDNARPLTDALTHDAGDGGWTAERTLLFVADVADALGLAHAAALSHESPNAANVLVRPDGMPVLQDLVWPPAVDFVDGAHRDGVGQQHDARADVYALGALLRRLLEVMELRGNDVARAVIRRAMAPRPGDRYPDGAALAHALRSCAEGIASGSERRSSVSVAQMAPRPAGPATVRRQAVAPVSRRRSHDVTIPIALALAFTLWPAAHILARGFGGHGLAWPHRPGFEQPFGHQWDDPGWRHPGAGEQPRRPWDALPPDPTAP